MVPIHHFRRFLCLAFVVVIFPGSLWAESGPWTLESTTRRVQELAPERRAFDAEVAVREAELRQAGSWPNPSIDLRADNKLGQEDGRGGSDFTRAGVSQPLPLWRLARGRTAAEAALRGSEAIRRFRQLELEQETARVFHTLQFSSARLAAAQDRFDFAQQYASGTAGTRDRLVRFLAPLERRRLALLQEEANQAVLAVQREHDRALTDFRSLLGLPADATVVLAPLALPATPPELATLERGLDAHPALTAAQQETEAARAGIALAESQRFADPVIGVFRERDYLNGARRDATAVELSVQIPLWNLNRGPVERARAETLRAQANLTIAQREAVKRLRQSHSGFASLVTQAERMRSNLLEPAREVLELTRRAFVTGESNILALVDANNTYYDTQARYLEVLKDSQVAAAALRLAAGQSIVTGEVAP